MILGFLGKGGSGKTTLSTALARYLHEHGSTVLAVDADHNMDFSYNLGIEGPIPYLGDAMHEMRKFIGMHEGSHYRDLFASFDQDSIAASAETSCTRLFSIAEGSEDEFTRAYSVHVAPRLKVMSAGPHTEEVLHGNHCSHSLSTPLRTYLPLLSLADDEHVVVDEKAGRDGAGTGTPSGFDIAFICAEPTPHGMKAAGQIAEILDFLETPYEFVINKADRRHADAGWDEWKQFLNKKPIAFIPLEAADELGRAGQNGRMTTCMKFLMQVARDQFRNSPPESRRLARSIRKFKKQKEFIESRRN